MILPQSMQVFWLCKYNLLDHSCYPSEIQESAIISQISCFVSLNTNKNKATSLEQQPLFTFIKLYIMKDSYIIRHVALSKEHLLCMYYITSKMHV